MATMEHCALENTASDMAVALKKLEDVASIDELNAYEQKGLKRLLRLCPQLIQIGKELLGIEEDE